MYAFGWCCRAAGDGLLSRSKARRFSAVRGAADLWDEPDVDLRMADGERENEYLGEWQGEEG